MDYLNFLFYIVAIIKRKERRHAKTKTNYC